MEEHVLSSTDTEFYIPLADTALSREEKIAGLGFQRECPFEADHQVAGCDCILDPASCLSLLVTICVEP